ncbi:hypothetical protein BJ508DRAFT_311211 [Ascobolus immersus RN42]|uniref:Uncharacterized protein n=1 Tax=Ascobolus immersus RN42 TaxID=1160509 RepID=A0A3N4HSM0_ASCIM|nr:hypothetical protein BJ508DRAFT_311211 [Ascobolus immersus RN42]
MVQLLRPILYGAVLATSVVSAAPTGRGIPPWGRGNAKPDEPSASHFLRSQITLNYDWTPESAEALANMPLIRPESRAESFANEGLPAPALLTQWNKISLCALRLAPVVS